MIKRKNKRGFTIVELVIVIAVIGILAGILIPTFSSLIAKANLASDNALVRELNNAITMDAEQHGKHETIADALKATDEYGLNVQRLNAKASQNKILWDSKNDVFCYLKDGVVEYNSASVEEGKKLSAGDYRLWVVANNVDAEYSTYLYNYSGNGNITTSKGLDVGNEEVSSILYSHTGPVQVVDIRTNGGILTINAKLDTVKHYGEGLVLDIQAIAGASYHEYGYFPKASIAQGRFVVEEEGEVPAIEVPATATGEVTIVNKGEVSNINVGSTSQNVSIENNGILDSVDTVLAEGTVTIANTGKVENVLINASTNVTGIAEDQKIEVSSTIAYTTGDIATAGYYYLTEDLDGVLNITATAGDVIINGNGKTIRRIANNAVLNETNKNYVGIDIKTAVDVTISNLSIYAGVGIQVNADGEYNLAIDNVNIYAARRGVSFLNNSEYTGEISLKNSLIENWNKNSDSWTFDSIDYQTTVGKSFASSDYPRGFSLFDATNAIINIEKTTIQGFYYEINIGGTFENTNFNINKSTLIGRAGLNVWASGVSFEVKDTTIRGINVYLGKTEDFANVVNNSGATNNTYIFDGCVFEIYRAPATGTNGQHAIDLRETGNTVKLTGNNTVVADVYFDVSSQAGFPESQFEIGALTMSYEGDIDGKFANATMKCYQASNSTVFNWNIYAIKSVKYDTWDECLAIIEALPDNYVVTNAYVSGGKYYYVYFEIVE